MEIGSIYINLPVKDLEVTRTFWTKLGFEFNSQFSNDKGICMVLKKDTICVMFLQEDFFQTFTNRPVSDRSSTQLLSAIDVESREKVDEIVKTALENGATRYRESEDHGWMYYDSFSDPDGHQWEIMYSDITLLPQE